MLRTFLSVFPEATLWQQGAVLIGSNRPIEIDPIQIEAKLRDPALQPILAENHLLTTQDVLRERIAGPLALAELAGDGPLITDRQPWIEYFRSQPSGSRLPDFLWFPAARQIAAWAEPGDGLFTSHDELVAALDTVSGVALDRVALDDMQDLDRLRRLWVATRGDELLDPAFARQLQAGWHLVADDEVGHGRLRLFARPLLDPPLRPANVNAAGVLRLTGMAIDAPIVEVGGTMLLHVQWQIQRPPPGDLAIDVRLVDERGRIAAALRRLPVLEAGAAWSPGTVVDDRSGLRIPPGTPAGRYAIDLTLSTLTEGRPLLATAGGTLTVGLIRVHDAGRPFPAGAVVAARCAVALDDVHLVGVTLPSWAAPASTAEVQLYWQPQRDGAERQALLLLGDPAQAARDC
ncbi:MAG: hypothetical protein KatS3mg060_3358 [Dehalococcoidia bacterium]|nr:MAG: hypothetical protein KatS3mg060_3358 [Dehalococcoidia bacterium]